MKSIIRPALLLASALLMAGCARDIADITRSFSTIVIDAGHGGHDFGARGRTGPDEKALALDVARDLNSQLRQAGFRTVMTRDADVFVTLDNRVSISNQQDNAIFVSIHFNDSRSSRSQGIETYYHSATARELAERIQEKLTMLPGTADRGIKTANFRVLRNARCPAVLVECGFLSNGNDSRRVSQGGYREAIARKIAEAVVEQRQGSPVRLAAQADFTGGQPN